jgi:IS30 family transposase
MLRLHHDGVSAREIGRTLGVARSTIQDNLRRAQAIGMGFFVRVPGTTVRFPTLPAQRSATMG